MSGRTGIGSHDWPAGTSELLTTLLYHLSELELLFPTSVFFNRVVTLRGRVPIIFLFVPSNLSTARHTVKNVSACWIKDIKACWIKEIK